MNKLVHAIMNADLNRGHFKSSVNPPFFKKEANYMHANISQGWQGERRRTQTTTALNSLTLCFCTFIVIKQKEKKKKRLMALQGCEFGAEPKPIQRSSCDVSAQLITQTATFVLGTDLEAVTRAPE